MSSSNTAVATENTDKLMLIELHDGIEDLLEDLDHLPIDYPLPDSLVRALKRYEKEYGKNTT